MMCSSPPIEQRRFPPVLGGFGGSPVPGCRSLEKAAQKHYRDDDVLASLSELWGIVSPVHDVALDLVGATLGAIHRVTCTGRNVVRRARRRRLWLVLPPLSKLLDVLLCEHEGPRMRV